MKLVIVKYNAGNIRSVLFAMERIGVEAKVTDNVEEIQKADKVIFPGVGEASSAMKYLRERKLDEVICNLKQPVLGICLGMQLLCRHSEENNADCLGIFDLQVKRFSSLLQPPPSGGTEGGRGSSLSPLGRVGEEHSLPPLGRVGEEHPLPPLGGAGGGLKVPQIGWNDIYHLSSPLFKELNEKEFVYFVHSYYVEKSMNTIATANYGLEYSAAIHKDNFYAVQFHPEKSAEVGGRIISNFMNNIQ